MAKLKDADPFDLLCFVAFDLKPLTRRERADRAKKAATFATLSAGAREIIDLILEKYVQFGVGQLDASVLEVTPISERGNILEIAALFDGAPNLLKTLDELQKLLYSDAA